MALKYLKKIRSGMETVLQGNFGYGQVAAAKLRRCFFNADFIAELYRGTAQLLFELVIQSRRADVSGSSQLLHGKTLLIMVFNILDSSTYTCTVLFRLFNFQKRQHLGIKLIVKA